MTRIIAEQLFREAFHECLREEKAGTRLKDAAINRRMAEWTEALTNLVVETCRALKWTACARWNPNDVLPQVQKEYFTLDVTAFSSSRKGWQPPLAAMELENNASKPKIAYCLWKLLGVNVGFRCLFCYREQADDAAELLRYLRQEVVQSFTPEERGFVRGQTVICIGTRGDAETFPYGFFRWWRLNFNTSNFEVI
jgi:hypothetical protein